MQNGQNGQNGQNWQIGEVEIQRVVEFEAPLLDTFAIYPDADAETLARHKSWLEPRLQDPETGLLILAFHTFVIRTPRHVILVDTCGGNDRQRPQKPRYHMNSWPYLENLATAGVQLDDVDFVLCTHLHVDHVGWNTRLVDGRWVPTFPNAKYLFARDEWAFWEEEYKTERYTDDPYYEDSILPVIKAGSAVMVDGDHVIDDWVRLSPTPGHTPGHVCVHVECGGAQAVMSGDLMHHALQCAEPDWSSCFCVDPAASAATRRELLATHAETPTLVMPAHFPSPGAGRIIEAGDTWRFKFSDEE
ncbi:MAG: MBL fold metallo-hydrolase [Rhodospirillaceae bacterium]|nr:MBL fold metallo-hydrolase [Rhodospirillaceae bacterium]